MRTSPHFVIAFFVGVVIAVCSLVFGCGKNPMEMFFHPNVDTRFSDSLKLATPTAVAVNSTQFNFAVFSDVHKLEGNSTLLSRFGADVAPKNIGFFVVVGDLTENATTTEYNEVKTELQAVGIPYYATIGNHDLFQAPSAGGWGGWKSTFGPGTYSVTIAGVVRFIFLDSASETLAIAICVAGIAACHQGDLYLRLQPLSDLRWDDSLDLPFGELRRAISPRQHSEQVRSLRLCRWPSSWFPPFPDRPGRALYRGKYVPR